MLSARKIELLAKLKVQGLDLRILECARATALCDVPLTCAPHCRLDFYMSRYVLVAGLNSFTTALGYVGIIKIKIPVSVRSSSLVLAFRSLPSPPRTAPFRATFAGCSRSL